MKFNFKRKYSAIFFVLVLLITGCFLFYTFGPSFINREQIFFNQVLLISILDSFLITIFIFGSHKVNYYLYHDHLEIHRSLRKTININYDQIESITEKPNDTVFLMFGKQPSYKLKYRKGNKIKGYRMRVERSDLIKLILENEKKVHITMNK